MTSQARHARPRKPVLPRAVLRAAVAVSAAGAALSAGAVTASAQAVAETPSRTASDGLSLDLDTPLELRTPSGSDRSVTDGGFERDPMGETTTGLEHALPGAVAPVKNLQINPLAKTGVDPLDNSAGTQVADFRPVGTDLVTGPFAEGASLSELPVVGRASGVLPG